MKPKSFEIALHALEEAVERLESEELSLEESLSCFEAGVKSAARCQALLKDVETRVSLLLKDQEGNLGETPFEEEP